MSRFFKQTLVGKPGRINPNYLILAILLITFLGIGIYYYQQYRQKNPVQPPVTGPFACPVEPALAEATRNTGNHVYGGIPSSTKAQVAVLKNLGYYSGYCDKKRNPLWVAYKIDGDKLVHNLKRPGGFKVDLRTSSRINPNDYKASGYDRGHLAPNSAIASQYGKDAQLETFLMSNIVPQSPELNRKIWQKLEKLELEYAQNLETVWVITGPVFDDHLQYIKNQVEVPDALFKILFDEQKGTVRTMAFLVPQSVSGQDRIDKFLTSIDEIEKLTGLDFLAPLSDQNEDRLEAGTANRLW
ncbi:MAG: DNA/RNA non-specific endonuclease [Candidatus Rifleibacteriota bacterium]